MSFDSICFDGSLLFTFMASINFLLFWGIFMVLRSNFSMENTKKLKTLF